jgi:hypothetical protein
MRIVEEGFVRVTEKVRDKKEIRSKMLRITS